MLPQTDRMWTGWFNNEEYTITYQYLSSLCNILYKYHLIEILTRPYQVVVIIVTLEMQKSKLRQGALFAQVQLFRWHSRGKIHTHQPGAALSLCPNALRENFNPQGESHALYTLNVLLLQREGFLHLCGMKMGTSPHTWANFLPARIQFYNSS